MDTVYIVLSKTDCSLQNVATHTWYVPSSDAVPRAEHDVVAAFAPRCEKMILSERGIFHHGKNESRYVFLVVATTAVCNSFREFSYRTRWTLHTLHICPFFLWRVRLKKYSGM
jgi:hypothetical protein